MQTFFGKTSRTRTLRGGSEPRFGEITEFVIFPLSRGSTLLCQLHCVCKVTKYKNYDVYKSRFDSILWWCRNATKPNMHSENRRRRLELPNCQTDWSQTSSNVYTKVTDVTYQVCNVRIFQSLTMEAVQKLGNHCRHRKTTAFHSCCAMSLKLATRWCLPLSYLPNFCFWLCWVRFRPILLERSIRVAPWFNGKSSHLVSRFRPFFHALESEIWTAGSEVW